MTKKRLFLLDSNYGDSIEALFKSAGFQEAGVEIVKSKEEFMFNLPRGYDTYFLYLSYLYERDLENLRREQPFSWIYLTARAGLTKLPLDLRAIPDRFIQVLFPETAREILEQIQDYRIPKEQTK